MREILRVLCIDIVYRVTCAFSTNEAVIETVARQWFNTIDPWVKGGMPYAGLLRVSANTVYYLLKPVWWCRGYS